MPTGVDQSRSSMTAVALDCKMVRHHLTRLEGDSETPETSAIAQVCVVDCEGDTLLLTHVQSTSTDTSGNDFTPITPIRGVGVRREELEGAPPLSEVRARVRELLHGRAGTLVRTLEERVDMPVISLLFQSLLPKSFEVTIETNQLRLS